jgi:hypothetical protein
MNAEYIKVIQRELNNIKKTKLTVDGILGSSTMAQINNLVDVPIQWNVDRKVVGTLQWICKYHGLEVGEIDGYFGDQTESCYDDLVVLLSTGKLPEPFRTESPTLGRKTTSKWPLQTTAALNAFYGPVGTNQVMIRVPYPLRIAWDTKSIANKIQCHTKIAESVLSVLEQTKAHYGSDISNLGLDLYGGCLNVRKMRGGTNYSVHSWGTALDFDPSRNQLKMNHATATFAKPIYNKWFDFWESEGATSLGRSCDFDWMHVQFACLK